MNEKWKKKLANAANNDDYVKLNTGLMRVSDLNNYLSSFPSNLLAFNKLGEFTYYKQEKKQLEEVFHKLSTGREKEFRFADQTNTQKRFMVDSYRAVFDKNHQFSGINESIQDIYPLVEYYLKETGQKLVDDPNNPNGEVYRKNQEIDAESGASEL